MSTESSDDVPLGARGYSQPASPGLEERSASPVPEWLSAHNVPSPPPPPPTYHEHFSTAHLFPSIALHVLVPIFTSMAPQVPAHIITINSSDDDDELDAALPDEELHTEAASTEAGAQPSARGKANAMSFLCLSEDLVMC